MENDTSKESVVNSFLSNVWEKFDTGKAIVAALAVCVLGYLANLLTSLYGFMYWNSYFEYYNLPIQYFESAVNSVNSLYGFVVAVPISVVYAGLQLKYNNKISKILEKNTMCNTRSKFIRKWELITSTYVVFPFISFTIYFFVLIITNGGNGFILSMMISSMILNILLTLFCGVKNHYKSNANVTVDDHTARNSIHTPWFSYLIIGVTIFVFSLFFVYLLGYYQKIILFDIPQIITADDDATMQEYGKLLETDSSYICVPISYEEGREHLMNIEYGSYRVIPKDEIVTITKSDAFAMRIDNGSGVLFDLIEYDEGAYWALLAGSVSFLSLLLYLEFLVWVRK